MPIKPENRKLYPANWSEIRASILRRANNKCEECGVPNHSVGARDVLGGWHDEVEINGMSRDAGERLFSEFPRVIRIVLTIAHVDHDPGNNDHANLLALCQLHHNRLDIEHRKETRAATYSARVQVQDEATGQLSFLTSRVELGYEDVQNSTVSVDNPGE